MRTESPLAPDVTAADASGAALSWRRRGDVVAVVLLITLPVVIYGVPALLGHAVLPGDDLTQSLPLRELTGLGPDSRVLLLGTEGVTDPASYRAIVGAQPA